MLRWPTEKQKPKYKQQEKKRYLSLLERAFRRRRINSPKKPIDCKGDYTHKQESPPSKNA